MAAFSKEAKLASDSSPGSMSRFQSSDPVAAEPRLFVGQLPSDCTEEMLFNVFSPFGTVKNLHLLKGGDGKPRGCAMVRLLCSLKVQ